MRGANLCWSSLSAYTCFEGQQRRMNSFVAEVWQAYQELLLGSVAREDSCGHVETIKELPTNRQGSVGYCISHY
jgi:hypothetical protein